MRLPHDRQVCGKNVALPAPVSLAECRRSLPCQLQVILNGMDAWGRPSGTLG